MRKSILTLAGMVILTGIFMFSSTVYGEDIYANGKGNAQCRTVRADIEWQGTGISVNPSDLVCVSAKGLWSHGEEIQAIIPFYGPRGFVKDEPNLIPGVVSRTGALIAKIDDNPPFVVEDQLCFVPLASGELFLSMNDVPGAFGNNQGIMKVRIAKQLSSSISADVLSSDRFISTFHNDCFK